MTTENTCRDCDVAVGQRHLDDCDIPVTSTPEEEDEGFIILDEMPAERQPEIATEVPKPAPQVWRQYTDDQLAHSCRCKAKMHMWEPIYKDGKETGEWRVYECRGYNWYSFRPSREVPWDAVLPSEEAAHEWMNGSVRR